MGTSRALIVESKRHFLDYGEISKEEGAELFEMMRRLFPLMKKASDTERIYSLAMLDGAPHFHLWLVPRKRGAHFKGVRDLAKNDTTTAKAAKTVVRKTKRGMTCIF